MSKTRTAISDINDVIDVASRVVHFVSLLKNRNWKVDPASYATAAEYAEVAVKQLRGSVGFNKNKKGYTETLEFIWNLWYNNNRREA